MQLVPTRAPQLEAWRQQIDESLGLAQPTLVIRSKSRWRITSLAEYASGEP